MTPMRNAFRCFATAAVASISLGACDEPAKPAPAAASANLAPPPAAPAVTSAPTAESKPAAAPKPKRKLEDCPKEATVTFENPAIEQAVRLKLPKESGPISKADLSRLRSLNISQVELSDLDVCLFTPMTGLKELFLGPGSYDDLSPIAGAKQLESLRASVNQVKDLTPLTKLTKLDRLDLGRTQVSDLKPLAELKALTELQLDDTPVEDVSPLAGLEKLENLSLKRTKVKDVSMLKGLKKLKFLYIGGSPLDEEPMSLGAVRGNGTKVISD